MSTENTSKINQLLSSQPTGIVFQSFWLSKKGYSPELQRRYRQSRWLDPISAGAMKRAGDKVGYEGALYALQTQSGMTIHPGGKTALNLLGKSHYLSFNPNSVTVFGAKDEFLPTWFTKNDWGIDIDYNKTSFLPADLGLSDFDFKNFTLKISNAPRALMECLYLVPEKEELMGCFHYMEGLNNIRPTLVQGLLENCQSIKVKRLFLYLAEKAGHQWFSSLELEKINLGKGKRSIVKNGVLNKKYAITISRELEEYGDTRI